MSSITSLVVVPPWRDLLLRELKAAKSEVLIASPYIKTPIARAVSVAAMRPEVTMRVLSRFKASDFSYGASDLEALWTLFKRNGRSHGVRTDNILHAKVYIFDRSTAYVGSSNLTYSGLERNREICIKSTDQGLVSRLAAEFDAMWDAAKLLDPADFGRMLADLQRGPETIIIPSSEDRFEIATHLEATQEFVTASLLDIEDELQPSSAFDSRAPELAELAELIVAAEHPLSRDIEPSSHESIRAAALHAERIEQYFSTLDKRFDIDIDRNPYLFAAAVCEKSIKDYKTPPTTISQGVQLELLFPQWQEQLTGLGKSIYEHGCASIAMRAGVAARFGAAAVSEFGHACLGQGIAGRQWTTNFLGPLVKHPGAEVSAKDAYETAAYRLMGAVLVSFGPERALALIENFFNPLDELGTDVASILSLRDVKTALQEIAQQLGLHPRYVDYTSTGPNHLPHWRCRVVIGETVNAEGSGQSKLEAEFAAASAAHAQMAQKKGWSGAIERWRGSLLSRYRRDARKADTSPWVLGEGKASRLTAALQVRRMDVDPDLAFQALIGPQVKHLAGGRDNLLLSHLGAIFGNACYRMLVYEANPALELVPQQRGFFAILPEALGIGSLLDEMGIPRKNGAKPDMDAAQGLIGALVITKREDAALRILRQLLQPHVQAILNIGPTRRKSPSRIVQDLPEVFDDRVSYVTLLQEVTQAVLKDLPKYHAIATGPTHAPTFHVTVEVAGISASARHQTKAKARNAAAFAMLTRLKADGVPKRPSRSSGE